MTHVESLGPFSWYASMVDERLAGVGLGAFVRNSVVCFGSIAGIGYGGFARFTNRAPSLHVRTDAMRDAIQKIEGAPGARSLAAEHGIAARKDDGAR